MIKVMKKIIIFFVILILFTFVNNSIAGHWDIEGWSWIDNKNKIVLWQKKEKEFISEALVSNTGAIGCEIVRGYTVKLSKDISLSDYQYNNYPIGIWKAIYYGFDSSGNIYLKIIREKEEIKKKDLLIIKDEIQKVSSIVGTEEDIIEKRLELFTFSFKKHLKEEGEIITIDPAKIVVISSINDLPPFKIDINQGNAIINVSVIKLE